MRHLYPPKHLTIKIVLYTLFIVSAISCSNNVTRQPIQVIPEPLSITTNNEGTVEINTNTSIVIEDSTMFPAANRLREILKMDLPIIWHAKDTQAAPAFVFSNNPDLDSLSNEGYLLNITPNNIHVQSAGSEGLFYAVETIRQLLPVDLNEKSDDAILLPATTIIDQPRFEWRGMHLDVSRHFMPLGFIKKYIDYLAMHKLNKFHWHLTDGIGWRIEIKSHPELTEIGAWRKIKEGKKPWQDFEVWRSGDSEPKYGGFYTQEEVREVVTYAKERFITIIPEIELPGHSEVVFQCYPELLCEHKTGKAIKNRGVYCASNPKSYELLETVIDEIIELFPSEYIHIGGDEVSKSSWNSCMKCQKMMKRNNYDAYQLQSHFVNHFDKYLKAKGRKLIGWHEILEGELSPSATVMYWGGENGVANCLKEGHPTVLTTGSHLYFDHYQSLSKQEPKAFGGYAPLNKVYHYEPVPENLENKYAHNILGIQANIWTEYMPNPKHVEYMLFPRLAALSEVAWSNRAKNWPHFKTKMNTMLKRYDQLDINYAKSSLLPNIQFNFDTTIQQFSVELSSELQSEIYYTLNGEEPNVTSSTKYTEPFILDHSATIKAMATKDGVPIGLPEKKEAILHKAIGCEVELNAKASKKYAAKGGFTLVDGDFGGDKWGNGKWLGILNQDLEATITLSKDTTINKVALSCIEETSAGIYLPSALIVEVSEDGKTYTELGKWKTSREHPIPLSPNIKTEKISVSFTPTTCRFVRVKALYQRVKNRGVFIFADELIVE